MARRLADCRPLRAVHGNIDGPEVRRLFPQDLRFEIEGLRVWMTHIGGRPGRYDRRVRLLLEEDPPDLLVCGHSHLLRVERDRRFGHLYLNPGACGHEGFHRERTLLRFTLEKGRLRDLERADLGPRGRFSRAARGTPG